MWTLPQISTIILTSETDPGLGLSRDILISHERSLKNNSLRTGARGPGGGGAPGAGGGGGGPQGGEGPRPGQRPPSTLVLVLGARLVYFLRHFEDANVKKQDILWSRVDWREVKGVGKWYSGRSVLGVCAFNPQF